MIPQNLPSNTANVIATQNLVGQAPVGQEDSSSRIALTKPVEQLSSTNKSQLRIREKSIEENDIKASPTTVAFEDEIEGRDSASDVEARREKDRDLQERREQEQLQIDQVKIKELAARDKEVRAHEQAHAAVGGQHAGAPTYEFERGPNGVRYAVGGEVSIDTGKEATPLESIQKAQLVRRAALAPAEPSPQDRRVAAQASRLESSARQELSVERRREAEAAQEAKERQNVEAAAEDESSIAPVDTVNSVITPNGISIETIPAASTSQTISSLRSPSAASEYPGSVKSRLDQSVLNSSPTANRPGVLLDQLA